MKQLYFLDEEEKNRILNIHENATKRHYLIEQSTAPIIISNNDNAYEYKLENGKYFFKGKQGTNFAKTYPDWREDKSPKGIAAIKSLFDKNTNVTQTQVKPVSNTDPSKAATETDKVSLSNPTTPVTTISSPAGTTTRTPVSTNTGSGTVSLDINDVVSTPGIGVGTTAVAGTPASEPTTPKTT